MFRGFIFKYTFAYVLDLFFGDPHFIYHPVQFIGFLISNLEKIFYRMKNKLLSGGILVFLVLVITFFLSFFITKVHYSLEIYFLYTTLSIKSLSNEGKKVYNILKENKLEDARKKLSYLVSRDTEDMNKQQIIMSVIETISENTVDGVISPIFYAVLGSFFIVGDVSLSLPFAMTYKAINTLDSMIGYKNDKYLYFGRIAAKIDDIANFIPARITGFILVPISAFLLGYDYKNSFRIFIRDRLNHASINSGHAEAAYAGALGLQFGGRIKYFGKFYEKMKIGNRTKEFDIEDIKKSIKLLYVTSTIGMVILVYGFTWWKYL